MATVSLAWHASADLPKLQAASNEGRDSSSSSSLLGLHGSSSHGRQLAQWGTGPCPPGTGRATADSWYTTRQCCPCPRNTYNTGSEVVCVPCPVGSYTADTGATSKAACVCYNGYRLTSKGCSPDCPPNYYLENRGMASSIGSCLPCPAGRVSPRGSVGQLACRATRQPASPATIVCQPGYGKANGRSSEQCVMCPAGRYSLGGATARCIRCPDQSISKAGASTCACFAGRGWADCHLCPAGTFSPGGSFAPCIPCGLLLTSPPGAPSIDYCKCVAGFGSTTDRPDDCLPCPVGTYQPDPAAATVRSAAVELTAARAGGKTNTLPCTRCPAGRSTILTQASLASQCIPDCPPGYGTQPPNYNRCLPAPVGRWAPGGPIGRSSSQIQPCPSGRTTVRTMSATSKDCIARTTPSAISLRANSDSYSYTLASLTVPANLGVLANDNYTDTCAANTARATLLAVPVRGSVALDTDGGFVYTVTNPTPLGVNGDDSFTYTLTDCNGDTDTGSVALRFVRPPTANPDVINWTGSQTKRDAPGVLVNDVYPGCVLSRVTVEVMQEAKWGQVQLNSDGAWVYISRLRPGQSDWFVYRLTDCNGNTAEANVTLNFQPQPTAKDDVYEYNGEPFTKTTNVGVLANDVSEGSTEPLTAKLKTQALNGFVSLSRDGAFTYSPSTDLRASGSSNESVQAASADVTPSAGSDVTTMQAGDDVFTYIVTDGNGWSSEGRTFIRFVPDPLPTAASDLYNYTGSSTSQPLGAILRNDVNPATCVAKNVSLLVSLDSGVRNGVLTLAQDGRFTYSANSNPPLSDSFTYKITDCNQKTATARVDLVYQSPPVATADSRPYTGAGFSVVAPGVLGNDLIAPYCSPGTVTATIVTQARQGVVTLQKDGSYAYVPKTTPGVSDTWQYLVTDCNGNSATGTVTFTYVQPVKATDDVYVQYGRVYQRTAREGVLANDVTPSACPAGSLNASQILLSGPKNGYLVLNLDGSFIYTPGTRGVDDSFQYMAMDCNGNTDTATVRLVYSANDPFAATPVDDRYTWSGTSFSVNADKGVMANDIKANCTNGGTHTTTLASSSSRGNVAIASDGSFVYIATSSPGSDSFAYRLTDCSGNIKTATVTLVYIAPPVAVADRWTYTSNRLNIPAPGLLANDKWDCPDGSLTLTGPSKTANGLLAIDPKDGSFIYIASTTPSQSDSFAYTLTDCNGNSASSTVTLVYAAPPTAKDDLYEFAGGQIVKLAPAGVLTNDVNAAACQLTSGLSASLLAKPANGAVVLDKDGAFVYTPSNGIATASDSFTYQVIDCNSNTASATVTLRYIQPVPPLASPESFTFSGSNGAASITRPAGTLTSNDKWSSSCLGSSNRSVVSLVTPPVTGQLSVGEDGGFTYTVTSTSGSSAIRSVFFVYKLTDCNGLSDTARVDLNYAQPPIPVNDRIPYSASFFRTAAQGVLVNDQNSPACPNTPATASVVTPPRNTLSLNPDGSFNYLVLTTGDDSFVYRVTDCNGNSATATVDLPFVAASTATDDSFRYVGGRVTKVASQGVLINDIAAPSCQSGALTAALVTAPVHGVLTGGLSRDGAFVYDPFSIPGTDDQFTYRITDCNSITATATVKLVYSTNDPMALLAVDDKYSFSSSITIPTARGVLVNDRNAASCTAPLVPTVLTAAARGTVSLSADGSFSYVPGATPGDDSFEYQIRDCTGITDRGMVTLSYVAPPDAVPDAYRYTGLPFSVAAPGVLSNDKYGANCAVRVGPSSITTASGTFTLAPDGGFSYSSSAAGRLASDSFTYNLTDCNGNADTAVVTLTFVEPPTAIADTYTHTGSSLTVVDSAQVRGILFNDLNPACPGKPLIATVVNPTTWGVVTLTTDGGFTYVPNPNVQPGDDVFTYMATDCNSNSANATVTLKYVAPPKAVADSYSYPGGSFTLVDSAATRGILINDVNPSCPSTPLAPAITNPTTKGVVTLTTNGGFTYVPNANVAPGDDVFTYEVTDCKGNKASATVTLKYDVPATAAADSYSYSKSPLQIPAATGVLANDNNAPSCVAQNKPVTIAVVTSTTKGNLQINSAGDFVYTTLPGLATPADDSFTYSITDCFGNVVTAKADLKFVIAGLAKDDTYVYSASPLTITAALGLLANDVNAPACASKNAALQASRLTPTANGLVTVNAAGDFVYTVNPGLAVPKDDIFTYQTTDCNGVTSTATVTLKYELPVVVNADSYSYSASPYTVTAAAGLLANDVNPASCVAQGKALTAVRTSAPASGTVTVNPAGDFIYTSTSATPVDDSFTYEATDCNGQKRSGAVSLKYVLPATAKDDVLFYSASPLSVAALQGLLANDVTPASCVAKGAALTVARITPAASGTATVNPAGDLTYTVTSATPQDDSFKYQVTDCNGQTSTATVTLKYVLPVAVTDDTYKYSASPLTVAAAAGLLANDVNPPNCAAQGKPLTAVRTTAAASGTVVVNPAGDFVYTSTSATPIDDSFKYAATDCLGNVKTGTVTLQFVQAVVAKPDQFFYYASPVTFPASAGLLQNDVVPGTCAETTPTFAVVTPPTSGSVVVGTGGSVTYTSTSATPVTDKFTYKVTDCNGQTSTAEAQLVFEQPIVAKVDAYSYSTSPLTVTAANGLLNNDAVPPSCAGIAPTFAVATPPASGTVVLSNTGGGFVYTSGTPATPVTDKFTYKVTDCHGQSSTATVDLTFEQPIVANPDAFTYTASPLVIPASAGLLLNDINPASCAASPPTFSVDTPATKGTVLLSNTGGGFTYTSSSTPPATDSFKYKVTDCHGQTAVATATLTYAPPIVATADAYIFHKAPYTVDAANGLLKNDAVPLACAATPPTFRVVTPPAQGTVVITAGGAFTYTSTSAVPVTDSFTYEVTDCNGGKSTATAALTYEPPGKAVADTFTYSKSPLSLTALKGVLANDVNNPTCASQGKPLKVTAWSTASAGNVAGAADGGFIYTTAPTTPVTAPQDDTFTYTVQDCFGNTDTATVTLKYIKPGVALPDFYEVKTTATQASPMIVLPLGQPAGTDPKGVLFNDVNAPSCTAPLTAVLGTTATPKFGIVTLNADGGYTYTPNETPSRATKDTIDTFSYYVVDCNGNKSDEVIVQLKYA
ncbi:hypothetical protein OEZ85_002754 [Tetradesmus obliquus]|uniref:Tyrosine-protein kinase ephrin type A/B receptor-like domain-containing protein n=1 Tax=Tetradesmus obliquus TaxID=3088 RepID=A0ABY8TYM8_TETOB|nr:hypothetical protein OEZ85_002754 [Tetradesmus obliquus]